MKIAYPLLLAWLMLCCSPSFGDVINGDFDNGFNNWDTLEQSVGLATIKGTYLGIVPPGGGGQQALLATTSTGAGSNLTGLAGFLHVSEAAISGVKPDPLPAHNGTAIMQTITVANIGDKLTFKWNFLTNEDKDNVPPPAPQGQNETPRDTAFFSLSRVLGGFSEVFFLADPGDAGTDFPVGSDFARQTTYQDRAPYEFTQEGDYYLGFGVFNRLDGNVSSGLLVDKVTLTAVPEPTALAGLGLLGLALTMRRRRRK